MPRAIRQVAAREILPVRTRTFPHRGKPPAARPNSALPMALSAWETDRSGPLTALTWASDAPLVTVMNPVIPGLMARQWPMAWRLRLTRLLSVLLSAWKAVAQAARYR
jgi:hypothetical protein